MSTGHKIRRLDADELARYAAHGWTACARNDCRDTHVYVVSHTDPYGKRINRRVCGRHGVRFAERYKLDVPADPATASAGARTVASPGGHAFEVCPVCTHWLGRTTVAPGECVAGCRCKAACHTGQAVA